MANRFARAEIIVTGVVHSVGSVAGHRDSTDDTKRNRVTDCAPELETEVDPREKKSKTRKKVAVRVPNRVKDDRKQKHTRKPAGENNTHDAATTGVGALGSVRVRESLKHNSLTRAAEKEEDARRGILKVNSVTAYLGTDRKIGISTV